MRFSLIYEAQTANPSRAGDHQIFTEVVEQALLAEEMGFDVIWAVEHTCLTMYAHMSAPETFLAYRRRCNQAHPYRPRRDLPARRR